MEFLPGSVIKFEREDGLNAFGKFMTVLTATNGITFSQLQEITGLSGSTIQNWIKRGWVVNPVDKRYGEVHLARILLINMVRDVLPLESIAEMMSIVNGSVSDRGDDMLPDREWYNILCRCIFDYEEVSVGHKDMSYERLRGCISKEIACLDGLSDEDRETLSSVLFIMVNAYIASLINRSVQKEWDNLLRRKK